MNDTLSFDYFPDMLKYFTNGTRDEVCITSYHALEHPIHIRRGTSDIKNFEQIFEKLEYLYCIEKMGFVPSVILDLGAYVGWSALYFKSKFPDATIICVEPSEQNFEILKLNTQYYKDIHCINAAVWVNHNELDYTLEGYDGDWGNRIGEVENGTIKAITINDIIKRFKLERVGLLKMDIETSEKQVLTDGTQWIDKVDAAAIELHDRYLYGCQFAFDNLFSLSDFDLVGRSEISMAFRRKRNE